MTSPASATGTSPFSSRATTLNWSPERRLTATNSGAGHRRTSQNAHKVMTRGEAGLARKVEGVTGKKVIRKIQNTSGKTFQIREGGGSRRRASRAGGTPPPYCYVCMDWLTEISSRQDPKSIEENGDNVLTLASPML